MLYFFLGAAFRSSRRLRRTGLRTLPKNGMAIRHAEGRWWGPATGDTDHDAAPKTARYCVVALRVGKLDAEYYWMQRRERPTYWKKNDPACEKVATGNSHRRSDPQMEAERTFPRWTCKEKGEEWVLQEWYVYLVVTVHTTGRRIRKSIRKDVSSGSESLHMPRVKSVARGGTHEVSERQMEKQQEIMTLSGVGTPPPHRT